MGMNKYLVTLRLKGQLIKTAVYADSATHARLMCEYQFGVGCLSGEPIQLTSEGHSYPLLDELAQPSTPSIKPQASKPPKPAVIKPIKPLAPKPPKIAVIKPAKPPTPDQLRLTQLKANVDRQKDALKRERENQKRQREAEHRWRNLGGI